MRFISGIFLPKQKPLQTVLDENRKKPVLNKLTTTVPQSYLDKTKQWDEHLYNNKTVLNDKA